MSKFTFSILILLALLCASATAFSQESKVKLDFGSIDKSTYTNPYFGLKLTIPDQWQVQDDEVKKRMATQGVQMVAGDNQNLKNALDLELQNTFNLLAIYRYPLGSPVDFNSGFICIAEKVSQFPGIKSPKDYLFLIKRTFQKGQGEHTFEEAYSETISGREFSVMPMTTMIGKQQVKQKFYTTLLKGYALNFTLVYTTDEELESLNAIIKSVTIER